MQILRKGKKAIRYITDDLKFSFHYYDESGEARNKFFFKKKKKKKEKFMCVKSSLKQKI